MMSSCFCIHLLMTIISYNHTMNIIFLLFKKSKQLEANKSANNPIAHALIFLIFVDIWCKKKIHCKKINKWAVRNSGVPDLKSHGLITLFFYRSDHYLDQQKRKDTHVICFPFITKIVLQETFGINKQNL